MMRNGKRILNAGARATASDTAALNPLDAIADDHMREREICALIDQLAGGAALEETAIDQMLVFLEHALPHHLADEEIDLFPMMLARCDPEEEIETVITKLQTDHRHAFADAPAIAALIRENRTGDTVISPEDAERMTRFAHQARRHLILENAVILPIARARLTADDLEIMKRHMRDRRARKATPC